MNVIKQSKTMPEQTFFITGANSGFGLAIAKAALEAGHRVIGHDPIANRKGILAGATAGYLCSPL